MHPSKLISEAACIFNQDTINVIDCKLKDELMDIHPLNFIKTKIHLPLFRVSIEYDTNHENHRTSQKYMIMNSPMDKEGNGFCDADFQAEVLLADYNKEHPENPLKNLLIHSVDYICDLVLPIG